MVFQGDMLSSNRRPSGGVNSEVRCHRALIVCGACFSSPYASFKWMWTPITKFYREICSPLTGRPSGVRNSEVRCHRVLIFAERVPLVQTHLLRGCGPL